MPNPLGVGLLVDFAAKMSWPIVRDAGVVCPEKAEPFAVLIYSLLAGQGQQEVHKLQLKIEMALRNLVPVASKGAWDTYISFQAASKSIFFFFFLFPLDPELHFSFELT